MERRSGRQRKPINYAQLITLPDDDDEERQPQIEPDGQSSGSDFADNTAKNAATESSDDGADFSEGNDTDLDDRLGRVPIASSTSRKQSSTTTSKNHSKSANRTVSSTLDVIKPVFGGASLLRSSKRQVYALPVQSVHHRHRAQPLFKAPFDVERLGQNPILFVKPSTVRTNNFTKHSRIADRVGKAWGYNVGPGPMWELAEDRGWYKEAKLPLDPGFRSESLSRPLVHKNVHCRNDIQILTSDEAAPFIPKGVPMADDTPTATPPSVSCFYGPVHNQTAVKLDKYASLSLSQFFPDQTSFVFNPGAPVWGMDWCPIHADERPNRHFKQYLAVAPLPSHTHSPEVGVKVSRPMHACIQLWSLSSNRTNSDDPQTEADDTPSLSCELVMCLDTGPCLELKWCPLPSHDNVTSKSPRKLGLLGAIFEDGSFCVYVVPDPKDLAPAEHDRKSPIYVKIPEPLIRIELRQASCSTFDWANSEVVCIGTTHGTITVYNLGSILESVTQDTCLVVHQDLQPTHYLTIHQSAIRAVTWIRVPPSNSEGVPRYDADPTVICSGGYDGMACITDIREGHGSVMNRTRDAINAMTYSCYAGGVITVDHENVVKGYSASPSTLGKGHLFLEPQGPIWSLHASDLHPQLAVGSADGSCYTTNTLRSARRSAAMPFFIHRIYRMDYNRNTGEFRMLDRFLPQENQDKSKNVTTKSTKSKQPQVETVSTGVWPEQVAVQSVVWNSVNGLAHAGLLASSTGSGLCRIDNLWGRFWRDRVPYHGTESIRMEDEAVEENAMDIDSANESGEEE